MKVQYLQQYQQPQQITELSGKSSNNNNGGAGTINSNEYGESPRERFRNRLTPIATNENDTAEGVKNGTKPSTFKIQTLKVDTLEVQNNSKENKFDKKSEASTGES